MRPLLPLALLRLALLWLPFAAAGADLGIMPVSVQLDRQHSRSTVQVVNRGSEPVILQAGAIAWTREGGLDVDAPTGELIVNPPLFTLQPGQTQVVRLGLRRATDAQQETSYRLVLQEVPAAVAPDALGVSGTVRVLVALRVPVYVAPNTVVRDERWKARTDSEGNLIAEVRNAGNVHLKVGSLRLREGDASQAPMAEQAVGTVLFPGEMRSFRLRPRQTLAGTPLTLEVMTDRGPQHVALDLAAR
jgi:fimbrial chaperone protein